MFDRPMMDDDMKKLIDETIKNKIEEIKNMLEKVDIFEIETVYNYLRNKIIIEEGRKEICSREEISKRCKNPCVVGLFGVKEVKNTLCLRCSNKNIELFERAAGNEKGKKVVLDSVKGLTPVEKAVLKNTKIWFDGIDTF